MAAAIAAKQLLVIHLFRQVKALKAQLSPTLATPQDRELITEILTKQNDIIAALYTIRMLTDLYMPGMIY